MHQSAGQLTLSMVRNQASVHLQVNLLNVQAAIGVYSDNMGPGLHRCINVHPLAGLGNKC